MKKKLFFHIAATGQHQAFVDEACWALTRSGLLKELDEVVVRISGDGDVRLNLEHGRVPITRAAAPGWAGPQLLKPRRARHDQSLAELWRLLRAQSAEPGEGLCTLFLSNRDACEDAAASAEARRLMLHHMVDRWQERLQDLQTAPACWCRVDKYLGLDAEGAFWWARLEALKGCGSIAGLLAAGKALPASTTRLYRVPDEGAPREQSQVLFTLPGKLGDNLARLPVAHQYAEENGCLVDLCLNLDSRSLVPVLQQQEWVGRVLLTTAIKDYKVGGRPYDLGNPKDFQAYRQVYHLGYRSAPEDAHFTTHALIQSEVPLKDRAIVGRPCLRLQRHDVQDLCIHLDGSKPAMNSATRRMLLPIYGDLAKVFRVIRFIGMSFDPRFYSPFRGPNILFVKADPLSMAPTLGILETSTVFCVDSSVRWLAYAAGVEAVLPFFGDQCSYHGESSPNETLANHPPDILAALLKAYVRHNGAKFILHTKQGLVWSREKL